MMVPATFTAWPKSICEILVKSFKLFMTDTNKIAPTTKNLATALPSCINASVPNIRFKPVIGLSLLNLGSASLGEKINPPDNVVDKAAITAMRATNGNTMTKPSTMALPKIAGSNSALSVIFLSNCNWLLNKLPMLLKRYCPIMVKNKVAITIMAAGASSCERAIWPSSRALLSRCAVGSSVLSWPLSSAISLA